MKFKTVIENRFPEKKIKDRKNKILIAILILSQTVINQIIPFTVGVYFGLTKNIYFLLIFFVMLFFEIRVSFDDEGNVKIKILRGI